MKAITYFYISVALVSLGIVSIFTGFSARTFMDYENYLGSLFQIELFWAGMGFLLGSIISLSIAMVKFTKE